MDIRRTKEALIMATLRFSVDDKFMDKLKKDLKLNNNSDVAKEALTLLRWAINEKKLDREILSSDSKGKDIKKLITHNLAKVEQI